jgi:hypothetical protein
LVEETVVGGRIRICPYKKKKLVFYSFRRDLEYALAFRKVR